MFTNHHSAKRKQMQIYANILNKRQLNADFIPCIGMGGAEGSPPAEGYFTLCNKKSELSYSTKKRLRAQRSSLILHFIYTCFTL